MDWIRIAKCVGWNSPYSYYPITLLMPGLRLSPYGKGLLLLLLCMGFNFSYAQMERYERLRDSLLTVLPQAEDTLKAYCYYMLATNAAISDSQAGVYSQIALHLSDSLGYANGQIRAGYILGHLAFGQGDYPTAVGYYRRAMRVAQQEEISFEVLKGLEYISNSYFYSDTYDSARVYNRMFLQEAQKHGTPTQIGDGYSREGMYYSVDYLITLSVNAYLKAVEFYLEAGDSIALARGYGDMALTLEKSDEDKEAEQYYQEAIDILENVQAPIDYVVTLINFSLLHKKTGELRRAERNVQKADSIIRTAFATGRVGTNNYQIYQMGVGINGANLLAIRGYGQLALDSTNSIWERFGHILILPDEINLYKTQAMAYLNLGKLDQARQNVQLAREKKETLSPDDDLLALIALQTDIELAAKNYEAAFRFQKSYQLIKDSLQNQNSQQAYRSLLLEYETEAREREIAELEQQNLQKQREQDLLLAGIGIIGLIGAGIIAFFWYRNRQNRQLLTQERELDHMKSRFFTQISHELRTPLTLILGPLEQLGAMDLPGKATEKLALMRRNGNQTLQLVNQVLALSKSQAGKLELKASPVSVSAMLKVIYANFSSKAEVKALDYQLILPEEDISLYLDQEKFQQIIGNLISNGCKFVPNGGKLWISLSETSAKVQITVEDNGPGLTDLQQAHIFDPYYQAPNQDYSEEVGTGIGLALCKELVELHGGNIAVSSQAGAGTTFTLAFPKGKAHLKEEQIRLISQPQHFVSQEKVSPTPLISAKASHSNREEVPVILIAEDIPDMRQYLQSILQADYSLIMATDGQDALAKAAQHMPDLIITDIMMPRMDGMSLVQRLKSNAKTDHIPVIFLSAKSEREDRMEGWKREAFAYLAKPFHPQELRLVVESALTMQQRMQVRFQGEVILKPSEVAVSSQESQFLLKLRDYLEAQLDNTELSIEQLAEEMALSRSQLARKLKALTGQTPTLFVRNFRMQRAKQLLEGGFGSVSEVADAVGISSSAYFSRIYSETFGYPPSEQPQAAKK